MSIESAFCFGFALSLREGWGSPYNGLNGETLPERDAIFTMDAYKRIEILRVEV